MVSDVGRVLNLFGYDINWKGLLYGEGRVNPGQHLTPDKLLSVALRPYMEALRECAQHRYVDFPEGDLQMVAEVPGEGRVILPFPVPTLTAEQATEHDRLALLYLPLQRAGLVDAVLTPDGGVEAVSLNDYGRALLESLKGTGYFDE